MKKMRIGAAIVCAALSASAAFANPAEDLERIAVLSATLESGGIAGMLAAAGGNGWVCPWIPDKWHVENVVKDTEVAKVADAGRDFGIRMARELEKAAEDFQTLPPGRLLLEKSTAMCGLAEWVNKPDGIGNLLLTGKCLDLASVGLGRLVADIGFPLESCQTLAGRIRGDGRLIDVPRRVEILDFEHGTDFFGKCRSDEDLERTWVAGARRDGRNGNGFFAHVLRPVPPTVANLIQKGSNHEVACAGVRGRSMTKALGLLDFRREIGYFPKPWVRSAEGWKRLKEEIAEAAKWGITMTPAEESPSFDPLREAFQRTWREKVPDIKRSNDYIDAFYAYKEISEGRFFDEDTAMIRLKQEGRQLMQKWKKKQAAELQKGVEGSQAVP